MFGRRLPDGGLVTPAAWDRFVREVVAPRFPAGFSLWYGEGQWCDDAGRPLREPAATLEVVHGDGGDAAVRAVAAEYRRRFRQAAVLWLRTPAQIQML